MSKSISSESVSLARLIVQEESGNREGTQTLKEYWIKLGNQLEIDGIEPEEISKVSSDLILEERSKHTGIPINDLYMGSWFYEVCSERGWVHKDLGRPKTTESFTEPEKKNSSKFEEENFDSIELLKELKEWCTDTIKLFQENHFQSIVPKDIMNETLLVTHQAIQHARDNMNNKTMIPHANYPVLFREFVFATSGGVSTVYWQHCKKKAEFTAKQVGKIVRALVQNMPLRYEPQNEDESSSCGFSGLQCKKCKNWRTEILFNDRSDKKQLHCYKCKESYDAPRPDLIAAELTNIV